MEFKEIGDIYQNESFESVESHEKVLLNLTQMGNRVRCKFHPKNEVILLCLQTQWHCHELCVDCVQQHLEQHKHDVQPASLKKVEEVVEECKAKVDTYLQEYQEMQGRVKIKQSALKENYSDSFTMHLDVVE